MKILSINSVPYGSTCNVMTGIAELASKNHSVIVAAGYSTHPVVFSIPNIKIGGIINKALHMCLATLTGYIGCFSFISTKAFLKKVDQINPDIIHLHNLHGWYINIPILFRYIKKHNIRVVWTLHDCWSFTGHCPHFVMAKCDKWKSKCKNCPSYRGYPKSIWDNAQKMYNRKKRWFTGVNDLTLVAPSEWLADLVKDSYLKEYSVKVINNGIDLSVFKPTESNFREKYSVGNKKIVLGVAFGWGEKKGLDVFVELAKRLPEDYQIVLVGTDDGIDKMLPDKIISIHRTQDQKELAEIYTAADLFVQTTREDNFPTVNLEALACGTPVLTFNTGGSPECIDETCGFVVEKDDIESLTEKIIQISETNPFSAENCIKRASMYDYNRKFREYLSLYECAD